jgi:hypothetical protein
MTKLFIIGLTTLLFGFGPVLAADDKDVDEFESRISKLNAKAEKPDMMNVALQRIATETGVPIENVRNQHKRHPQTGAGGLMVANVLANETKKAPSEFLTAHANGKKWLTIVSNNKVPVDKLNDRLERLDRAMTSGSATK